MSDQSPPPGTPEPPPGQPGTSGPAPDYPQYATYANQPGMTPQPYGSPEQSGPIGQIRNTWGCIGLSIVTLGIYQLYWYYKVHSEMKAHAGQGIGGGLALVIGLFASFVNAFITPSEIGSLYARRGQPEPVRATTGLWVIPGILIIVGPIIWFVKVNGALNDYWRSLGAT